MKHQLMTVYARVLLYVFDFLADAMAESRHSAEPEAFLEWLDNEDIKVRLLLNVWNTVFNSSGMALDLGPASKEDVQDAFDAAVRIRYGLDKSS